VGVKRLRVSVVLQLIAYLFGALVFVRLAVSVGV
jgi:hypothetical protein